ncbi:MATE family efflux transporter [Novosphingobium aquimarinum]|uniref:MATE family efflux transporter n=1 Tax=Novosphingobium aquimarinum TaxID=2682494 RepID=UPI0012EBCC38|nr:MATE family efflux transporter [Novosphingobium aquimarinum]
MRDTDFLELPEERPWRGEFAATFALSWPLALANLLQMLTYAVDVIFIARLGPLELAASSLCVSYFALVTWGLVGLTGAVAPLMSSELGARAPALRPVRRVMRMGLWLAVLSGALGMIVCLFADELMTATGQDPRIIGMAREYMGVLLLSTIPMIVANVLRSFVSALGRPVIATVITAGGIGVNALGNYALIFGNLGAPALGLTGAALATLTTSLAIVAAYFVAIALDPRMHRYHILGFWWRADWPRMRQLIRVGSPIGLTVVAEGGIFAAAAFMMGRLGPTELAAHTIALQLAALAFQVPFGVSQAATIRVGYFFGARDRDGVTRAGWSALAIGTGFMASTALAMLLVPQWLLTLYIDPWDPANAALVALALRYLGVAAAFQLFDGIQSVAAGVLRGLQDTRAPMFIAIFAYWLPGFGTAMVLGFGTPLRGVGVWLGLAIGLIVAAVLLVTRWQRRERLGLFERTHGPVPPL